MQRRALLEIVAVAAVAALLPRFLAPAVVKKSAPPVAPEGWNIYGVQPGMSRTQVEAALGAPDFAGPLTVANNKRGTYVEYGNKRATWDGLPTIVYDEDATVISVIGDKAQVGAEPRLAYRDDERKVLGALDKDAKVEAHGRSSHITRHLPEGDLDLSFQDGDLTRMILSRRMNP